ncbi:hypothetical protein D3C80_2035090 [compost metagenome]
MSPDPRDVLFLRLAIAELTLQFALGGFGQSHDNHTAGRHIQTMHRFCLRMIALHAGHHAVFVLLKTARHG